MATLGQLKKRFEAISVDGLARQTMTEAEPVLLDAQREQMIHGEGAKGKIGRYKNLAYAQKKFALNPLAGAGNVDLRLTGRFYANTYAEVRGDRIVFDSTDAKLQQLVEKYGEDIFGLNVPYKQNAIERIRPVFIKNLRAAVRL